MGANSDILIRDLSHIFPADAVTTADERPRKGRWRLARWESETDAGTCLFADTEGIPDITVPLAREGHCAISLGLFAPAIKRGSIRVKLTGDDGYDMAVFRRIAEATDCEACPFASLPTTATSTVAASRISTADEPWS